MWRNYSTTYDTSGSSLVQTAYLDENGRIISFDSGSTQVEKYYKTDQIGYKKVLSLIAMIADTADRATKVSSDGFNFTSTGGGFDGAVTMQGGNEGIYWNGMWFMNQYNGGYHSYRSDDNGVTWNDLGVTSAGVKYYATPTALYMYHYTSSNYFKRSTDGINWTSPTGCGWASGFAKLGSALIATQNTDLMVSTDDGLTWTGYNPLMPTSYGYSETIYSQYLIGCATITVGGEERLYFLNKLVGDYGAMFFNTYYITTVPAADNFSMTFVGNVDNFGYSMSDLYEFTSVASNGNYALAAMPDTSDNTGTHLYSFTASTCLVNYGWKTVVPFLNKSNNNLYVYTFLPDFIGGPATEFKRIDTGNTIVDVTSSFVGVPNSTNGVTIVAKS